MSLAQTCETHFYDQSPVENQVNLLMHIFDNFSTEHVRFTQESAIQDFFVSLGVPKDIKFVYLFRCDSYYRFKFEIPGCSEIFYADFQSGNDGKIFCQDSDPVLSSLIKKLIDNINLRPQEFVKKMAQFDVLLNLNEQLNKRK
jgi:hypothetical protein